MTIRATTHMTIASWRRLFDQEYVASNCTVAYDDSAAVDDTVGTYVTDYVVGVVGLVSGLLYLSIACQCRRRRRHNPNNQVTSVAISESTLSPLVATLLASYFVLNGIGYAYAGVVHQTTHSTEDPTITYVAPVLVLLGQFALALSVTEPMFFLERRHETDTDEVGHLVGPKPLPRLGCRWCLSLVRLSYVAVFATLTYLTVTKDTLQFVGGFTIVVLAMTAIYYIGVRRQYVAGIGNLVILAGLIVQVVLAGSCGIDGYENDCWEECPLPDPSTFNHNAVFHVLVAVGLALQAVGWVRPPRNARGQLPQ